MMIIIQNISSVYFLAQSNSGGVSSAIILLISIASYVFGSFCFMTIYDRLKQPNSWFAFIPVLNFWIMYKAGDESPWWLVGLFIPIVNFVATIILLMAFVNIVNKLDKNPWLILLMIIPLANFFVMYHFAFG